MLGFATKQTLGRVTAHQGRLSGHNGPPAKRARTRRWASRQAPAAASPRSSSTTRRSTRCPWRAGSTWPTRSPGRAPIRASGPSILAAEGRGFCAGVDIKEMQRVPGHAALLGANRGCFAAFAAVYDCPVPVIAAVHGFCLGGGVGLAGNADIVIAADDATFGLPEVDRGALGAATHLSRLVPQQLMRTMVYTCRTVTAAQLLDFGTVLDVVPPAALRAGRARRRRRDRRQGPGGHPAGQAVAERHRPGRRQALLPVRAGIHLRAQPHRRRRHGPPGVRRRAGRRHDRAAKARCIADGRRRAALGHDDRDRRLGIAAQADGAGPGHPPVRPERPDDRLLRRPRRRAADRRRARCAGSSTGFVSLDTIPLEPHFRLARQRGAVELTELDEGMLHWGLLAAAHRLPFLPIRAGPGLRRAAGEPAAAHGALPLRRRRGTRRHARAAAGRGADPPQPRRRGRQRPVPRAGPVLRRPVLPGRRPGLPVLRADRADRGPGRSPGRRRACWSTAPWCTAWSRRPGGAHFTSCVPDYGRDEAFQAAYAAAAADPADWQRFRAEFLAGDEASYQAGRAPLPTGSAETAQRRDGRTAGTARLTGATPGRGLRGRLRRGVARRRRHPGQPDGPDPHAGRPAGAAHLRPRPAAHRRRGHCCSPRATPGGVAEGWLPYRGVFTMLAAGRRHVMMGAAQLDRFGNQNISCIGD